MKRRNPKKTVSLTIEKYLATHVKAATELEKILYKNIDNPECHEKMRTIEAKIALRFDELRINGYSLGEIYSIIDAAKYGK